ncbi:ribonuclease H-like protein [Pholiota conissans]|uniref:ribonuclease H n=1 Tax=Pholiota conissans TaxID=109636 RepID=A0A9P5ZG03_9AGAR|nr:ribonuclease H-like protein [Pholiota conissans]
MAPKSSKDGYYAVGVGRIPGIYTTWAECENQTKGFPAAKFKKFQSLAQAEGFVAEWAEQSLNADTPPPPYTAILTDTASASLLGSSRSTPILAPAKSANPAADSKGKKRAFGAEVEDTTGWDIVYSDGACKGNGKIGSVAGVGVWWGPNDKRNIAERCPGEQTNNRAELIAILRVLETTPITKKPLLIRTDSQYSINCFRNWVPNWKRNHWKTSQGGDVKNAGIIRCIDKHLDLRGLRGQKVVFEYVKGHSGDIGNDGADLMANHGTVKPDCPERDWKALEAELVQKLSETDYHGEKIPIEVLGPSDDLPESSADPELPSKVRKTSSQEKTTTVHQTTIVTKTVSSPSPDPVSNSKTFVTHTTSQETVTTIRRSVQPSGSATTSKTKETKTTNYSHVWTEPDKEPLKVNFVAPSLLSDSTPEVDFSMYADCLLPDADLADELSD